MPKSKNKKKTSKTVIKKVKKQWTEEDLKASEAILKNALNSETKEPKEEIPPIFEATTDGFIFNPAEVWKKSSFPFAELNYDEFGFGVLLPRWVTKEDKQGNITTTQISSPVIISSQHKLHELDKTFTKQYKTKFPEIPEDMKLRWSLPAIKQWIDNKTPEIKPTELFLSIKKKYETFCYFQNQAWYSVHALWDMCSYFFMHCEAFPIFELRGLKRTGKNKIMDVSQLVTFNSTGIQVAPNEANLFRDTHSFRGSKYIDEAERLYVRDFKTKQMVADPRAEVINSGYKRGSSVPRLEKQGNKFKTKNHETYSPTMLASINGLYGATEDRAITHITTKLPSKDKRGEFQVPIVPTGDWQRLIDDLYFFALQKWKSFKTEYESYNNETKLRDRDFLIWRPLLTMAKLVGSDQHSEIKAFAERLTAVRSIDSSDTTSLEFQALDKLWKLLTSGKTQVLLSDIIGILDMGDYKPKPKTISNKLDKLGLMEFRIHLNTGSAYEITQNQFREIIQPQFPKIFEEEEKKEEEKKRQEAEEKIKKEEEEKKKNKTTEGASDTGINSSHSSHSSLSYINPVMNSDESLKEVTEKKVGDESVTNNPEKKGVTSEGVTNVTNIMNNGDKQQSSRSKIINLAKRYTKSHPDGIPRDCLKPFDVSQEEFDSVLDVLFRDGVCVEHRSGLVTFDMSKVAE